MFALLASLSLAFSSPVWPPDDTISRMEECWNVFENCQNEAFEEWLADAIDTEMLLSRWDSCRYWLFECQERAHLLDSLDNQVPIIPGVILFPPPFHD